MPINETADLPYYEHRAITELLRAHVDEHGDRLRAVVAFGPLVAGADTFDIDLLEIVDQWDAKRFFQFVNSAELPLRGVLRLYFITEAEILDPRSIADEAERDWIERLLDRVRESYVVIAERPPGYVRRLLAPQASVLTVTAPPSGKGQAGNPLRPGG
jgi:hypothetical protein